jgi:transposase-like protein
MKLKQRRRHTPESKANLLRRVLKDRASVADACEEAGIQVTQYYVWQKEAFERMERLFEESPVERERSEQVELRDLKEKLNARTIFCRELLEEHARLKKTLGEV